MKLLAQEKLYQWSNPVVEYRLTGKLRTELSSQFCGYHPIFYWSVVRELAGST